MLDKLVPNEKLARNHGGFISRKTIIQKCIDNLSLHVQVLSDNAKVLELVKSIHEPEWARVIRLITEIMSYGIIFQLYLPLIIKQKKCILMFLLTENHK